MKYFLIILFLFFFSVANSQWKEKEVIYIDSGYYKSLNGGFEFSTTTWLEDMAIGLAGNLLHAGFDYAFYPYGNDRTRQRLVQSFIDVGISIGCYGITRRWSTPLTYLEMRWCGMSDEFYYEIHGLKGNKKYANDFNPIAEHIWYTPIGLLKGKGVNKTEFHIGLSLSIPLSFITNLVEQRIKYNKKINLPNNMYNCYY